MAVDPIAAGDVVQVVIESSCLGQTFLNVLHYRAKTNPTGNGYGQQLANLIDAVGTGDDENIVPKMLALMSEEAKVVNVQAQRVYPNRDYYVRVEQDEAGIIPVVCNYPNSALVLTKQGEKIGRGRSGSFHLGGITDQHVALGYITAAGLILAASLGDKLGDPLVPSVGGFTWEPGLYNPTLGNGLNFNPLVGVFPRDTVRVMRRRTVGVGI